MTSGGNTAGEVLKYGTRILCKASMGTFTAQAIVFDGGLVHEDNTTGRRVGTYATPLRANDLVKLDKTVNNTVFVVQRMAASDNGKLFFGILEELRGKAGDTLFDAVVYVPGDHDIIELDAGADADAVDIVVGDNVSLDADAYLATRPHGFTVKKDNTNGFGYVINKIVDDGERIYVMRRAPDGL